MSEKAIILEVKNKSLTVVTSGGDFREVRLRGHFRPGQKIVLPVQDWSSYRYALAAACLAFFIITGCLWKFWITPAVAAYVCLDINPSVEMALDRNDLVRGVNPLNEDGKKIISGLNLDGKNVSEAIEQLIRSAMDNQYIQPGADNVILSSVVPAGKVDTPAIEAAVRESIKIFLQKNSIKAEVAVLDAPPGVRKEAGKVGLSTGRYMLYLNARERGLNVSPDDYKNKSIRIIEREQKIKISEMAGDNEAPENGWPDRDGYGQPAGQNSGSLPGNGEQHGNGKNKDQQVKNPGKPDKPGAGLSLGNAQGRDDGKGPGSTDKPANGWGPGGSKEQGNQGDKDGKGNIKSRENPGIGRDSGGTNSESPGDREVKEDKGDRSK